MPHLEEQFPPVNPLALLRPDALDPPDREEEEANRTENRDETPRPGTLADGIDRVTLSANARAIAPVQPLEETAPISGERVANTEGDTPAADEVSGVGLQDFVNGIEENRGSNETTNRIDRNTAEPLTTPLFTPAAPPVPNGEPATRTASRFENRLATQPVVNVGQNEDTTFRNDDRFVREAPAPRNPLSEAPANTGTSEPVEDVPLENPLGLRGNTPEPPERQLNILTPVNVGEDPPGPNIEEARNFGQGRTLSLNLESAGDEDALITVDTVDEALEDAGALPGPETIEEPPFELLIAPAVRSEFVAETNPLEAIESTPNLLIDDTPEPAFTDPTNIPGPAGAGAVTSSLIDTRQVFEDDRETQDLQAPAFPELDPDEPFVPDPNPETREEDVPAVAKDPLNIPPAETESIVPVASSFPTSVVALNENRQALRPDNLGTDPALRSNRALRNFLQEFNNRIEPPETVTESEGGPVTEVQNNAPPPPAAFENLENVRTELLNVLREQETQEGVTRPEEEHTVPPEPRTPEALLTERGQNIDRFI